ncbi:MAG: OmpA family protein, partial [Pseudomonadota bacterium]
MFKMFATAAFTTAATAALLTLPTLALAGPQYSAEDIARHFGTPAADAPVVAQCAPGAVCLPKSASRGVCIGSASKCGGGAQTSAARQDPGGFDLLITFELGSDRLSNQAQANLAEFAKAMQGRALSSAVFNVDGHTDASGSSDFNQSLSQRRAASVVAFLEDMGISRDRLVPQGYG